MSEIKRWDGEDLSGKSLLLWNDQGLGDAIQMARWIPHVKAGRITLYVEAPLFNLMRHSFASPTVDVRVKGWAFEKPDYHVPFTSLMWIFRATPETIPQGRYLPAFPKHRFSIHRNGRPLIGINWQGNPNFVLDRTRSMPLEFMRPLFEFGTMVSLQKGIAQAQLDDHEEVADPMDECADLYDTACLIDDLDIVVTTDTVIPHLAGAMDKPTFLLEQHETEWRWGFGPTSPWYRSVRVVRQPARGDWRGAVEQVREELKRAGR